MTVVNCFNPRCDQAQGADYGTQVIGLGAYSTSGPSVYTGANKAFATVDGVGTYLSDRHPPTFTTPTPPSPFWTNDGGQGHTIYVGEADRGLGIMSLTLSNAAGGNGTIMQKCNGAPASNPCPLGPITDSFTYTLNEGITQLTLSLSDITFNSAQQNWTELIDRTPPQSHLNVPPFVRQSPTLAGDASDPPAPGANGSSGIGATTVQILPPGSTSWQTLGTVTPDGNGAFSIPWNTTNGMYPDGTYQLRVMAQDRAGNVSYSATSSTIVDNTPPSVTGSGPLKDRQGQVLDGGAFDADVNATDPVSSDGAQQSGLQSLDVYVTPQGGASVHDLHQDCSGSTACSTVQADTYTLDTANFPDGATLTIDVRATDQAGNAGDQTWTVTNSQKQPTSACAGRGSSYTVYGAPDSIAGFSFNRAHRTCESARTSGPGPVEPGLNNATFVFGSCDTTDMSSCLPPVEIQSSPLCESHAAIYVDPTDGTPEPMTPVVIRGVPGALYQGGGNGSDGAILEIYTGSTTITLYGTTSAQVQQIAQGVVPVPMEDVPIVGQDLTSLPSPITAAAGLLTPPDPVVLASPTPCS